MGKEKEFVWMHDDWIMNEQSLIDVLQGDSQSLDK